MAAPFLPPPEALGSGMPDADNEAMVLWDWDSAKLYPDAEDPMVAVLLDDDSDDPIWRVADDTDAEWVMTVLASTNGDRAAIEAQADEYVRRVQEWTDRMTAPLGRRAQWAVAQLTAWALRRRADSKGAVKTVRLPSGEVRTRKPRDPHPVVVDTDALVAWCKLHHPDAVTVVETVKQADLAAIAKVGRLDLVDPGTGEVRTVDAVVGTTADGTAVAVPGAAIREGVTSVTVVPHEVR